MSTAGKPTTRRDLLYLLAQASELEHSLACQYLFTAFTLKERTDEGITSTQKTMIAKWRRRIADIATQEMLHLALASNLLTAIGGAPYFRRANFPQGKTYTSLSLRFVLAPFSEETLKRYICFELPQDFTPAPGEFDWNQECTEIREGAAALPQPLLPKKLDFHSIGELYRLISEGFAEIEPQLQAKGKTLFIGPTDAQATGIFYDMRFAPPVLQLVQVTDLVSAQKAIDLIIEQGEGTPLDQENNHFRWFIKTLEEYRAELKNHAAFQPVRPVVENPLLDLQRDQPGAVGLGANVITDDLARDVMEIFGAVYEVMLQILSRHFAHTDEDEEQLYVLKSAFLNLMPFVLSPIGSAITQLPAGDGFPGKNAGPSFEVFSDVQLLPHKSSAWPYFRERLEEISAACDFVTNTTTNQQLQGILRKASDALKKIAYPISFEPNNLTWANGISQLFSPMDVDHMKRRGIDLGDYDAVKENAEDVLRNVSQGLMPKPPLGSWTEKRVRYFNQWMGSSFPA